jgi:hypothetical protein
MNKKTKKKTKEKEVEKSIVFVPYFNDEGHYDLTVRYDRPDGTNSFSTLREAKKRVVDHYIIEVNQCREQMDYVRKLKIKDLIKNLLDEAKESQR